MSTGSIEDAFFTSKYLEPNVISISDVTDVHSFLICGEDRAVLVDTCAGIGNLKKYVSKLTNLPITVICTHGHFDHIGCSSEFNRVYLSKRDFNIIISGDESIEVEKKYLKDMRGLKFKNSIQNSQFNAVKRSVFYNIEDESEQNLGGISIELLPLKGHTQGMLTVLVKQKRELIIGDACSPRVLLLLKGSSTVKEYKMELEKFIIRYGALFDIVWISHGLEVVNKSIIFECIDLCEEIIQGKDDHVPMCFGKEKGFLAKTVDENCRRCDGKTANIAYKENGII